MKTILLTGGRAPATLELARCFDAAGWRVVVAESLAWHLCSASRAVDASHRIPAPRADRAGFITALAGIITHENVDLLIPTCEEIFHVAWGLDRLPAGCRVLVESLEKLARVHNKWEFVQRAKALGLAAPPTGLVTDPAQLAGLTGPRVYKPVYSRFAARTLIQKPGGKPPAIQPTAEAPWLAQDFIAGRQFCTYSIAHRGRLAAHTCYPADFTAGLGAAVHFRHVEHPGIHNWVKTFVEAEAFTGQIAFDFIETPQGGLVALECNPRATSGVHLLAGRPGFVEAFWEAGDALITPRAGAAAMLPAAMLLYGLPGAIHSGRVRAWAAAFSSARDAVFSPADPLPAAWQFLSLAELSGRALRQRVSALQASTLDIEWNGEP